MADLLCPVLVGRDAELGVLRAALSAAVRGSGGLVFVSGQPGIGKSRLTREVATVARASGVAAVTGRAVETGVNAPFRPLTEALLAAVRDRGLPDDADLAPFLPALRAVLPIPDVSFQSEANDSPAVRGEGVLRLLRRLAHPRALLVVLEDLQWADADTLAIVEYLSDNLRTIPVLCVASLRGEPRSAGLDLVHRLHARRCVTHLPLGRLDDRDVARMVRECSPGAGQEEIRRVRRAADGVPFLVEELLASTGVPTSFLETVRARLADLGHDQRVVLDAAAVLGGSFDWRLLSAATGQPTEAVCGALESGIAALLLTGDGGAIAFRHALTRDAVLEGMLPPRRSAIAARALVALEAAHPDLPGSWRDLAVDLAVQSGDEWRAGSMLAVAGRVSLERGALATSVDTLRRAVELLDNRPGRTAAEALLVEAFALAGQLDEAMEVGDRLTAALDHEGAAPQARAEVELTLAHAAVGAGRWSLATGHLVAAEGLLHGNPRSALSARAALLRAEVAIAADDVDGARRLAEGVLGGAAANPDVRCDALLLVGRSQRTRDLDLARQAFERGLAVADAAHLPIWRLRAMHELGTIEMFDHAGTVRLRQARRVADELGALSIGALLDLHLVAALMFQFDLDAAAGHACAAVAMSERLGLGQIRAIALVFLAELSALRRDRQEVERYCTLAMSAAPGDLDIEGSGWAGGRAMLALLEGDRIAAIDALDRGVSMLRTLPNSGPALYRGLWPLLLATVGDRRASRTIDEARQRGMCVNRGNRGLLAYAEAVLAGRRGDRECAASAARAAEADLVHYPVWSDLARLWVAEAALADGWGQPDVWLPAAGETFAARGLDALAGRCRALLDAGRPRRWSEFGLTAREGDVLGLVAEGLANKEMAAALHVSPRTVEKHVESLLRKTGTRSRTQLVAVTLAGTAG